MVTMSNLKFQMQSVGGKPQIFFGTADKQEKNPRKFGYKHREQRFPLREKVPPEEPPPAKFKGRVGGAAKQPPGKAGPPGGQKRLAVAPGKKRPSPGAAGGGTVTLTQEQLEMILSSVGKTAAADRDNSVRISVDSGGGDKAGKREKSERTDGGLSIEAEASPRRYARRRHEREDSDDDDGDSALGETADTGGSADENDRGRRRRPAPAASRPARGGGGGGGENVLGLLSKVDGGQAQKPGRKQKPAEATRKAPAPREVGRRTDAREKRETAAETKKGGSSGKKEGVSEQDMDRKMQRIIAENKHKMTESELVDLLAAVYLEERKKQLMENDEKEKKSMWKSEKDERRRRRDEEEEEEEDDRRVRRRPVDRDDDSDDERNRRHKRRPLRRKDDSEEERMGVDSEEEDDRRRRATRTREPRRRRHRVSDSENEEDEPEPPRNRRTRTRRQSGNKKGRQSPQNSEEEKGEEKESGRPPLEAPRFLTIAEKKRLQWEKEREELKNLKTYDPWGRPGAGAPPKEPPSPPVLSRKEEEQQRYARELSDQMKEKRELEQRDHRRYDGSAPSDGGLMNVDSAALQLSGSFARGRGMANLDEKTRSDLEEQRKRQVEHQEAIKKQVEERQAKRAQERERRIKEEQEEEARLQRERDRLQKQFDDEQTRNRRREVEHESRLAQLQAANEAAEQAAKMEKARRRMERLEGGGHDTSALRANLEAELTARGQFLPPDLGPGLTRPSDVHLTTYTRAAVVPGLEGIAEVVDSQMIDRWATPRSVHFPPPQPPPPPMSFNARKEDLQVQTDPALLQPLLQHAMELATAAASTAHAQDQPLRKRERAPPSQAPTQRTTTRKTAPKYQRGFVVAPEKPPTGRGRHPVPVNERPKWGNANAEGRKTLKQSEREIGDSKRQERELRRARREAELMAKVEANQNRIPRRKATRRLSDGGPSPSFQDAPVYMGTYNLEGPETAADSWRGIPIQPSGRVSPPIPTHRRKGGQAGTAGMSRSEENLVAAVGRAEAQDYGLVRTSEILNPAKAERPLPLSREDTERQLARKTYLKGLNPAHYGNYMANLDDHRMEQNMPSKTTNAKNPIFNPGIVKDMPTPRQDAILQHLSDIRKNLLQKQKEIETSLSMDNLV